MKTEEDISSQLAEAKAFLRLSAPFFASLVASSPITTDSTIETACVNEHGHIRINPRFFLSLDTTQRAVLLAHEIMHPAWGVFWRARSLDHDPMLSNVAHDHVINLIISESYQGWSLPEWLCDSRYAGMSYEEVYEKIQKSPPRSMRQMAKTAGAPASTPVPGSSSPNLGSSGFDIDPSAPPSADPEAAEAAWRSRIVGALQVARSMGSSPSALDRAVEKLLNPEVDWRTALFMSVSAAMSRVRLDWGTPHRRSDDLEIHLPSEEPWGYEVTIAVDTSGSISQENLTRACSEISQIVQEAGADGHFVVADAAVHKAIPLQEFSPSQLQGGGGTDFAPVFEFLEEHPPKLLIYFTDTFGTFPNFTPDYEVIWAVYSANHKSDVSVPFGEILTIPEK